VPAYAFDDYSTHLAIVYDEYYHDRVAISDGIAIRPTSPHEGNEWFHGSRVFWVVGNQPRPEMIGVAEGVVKYEITSRQLPPVWLPDPPSPFVPEVEGTFLVQMLDATRIRVERVMGETPDEVSGFGDHARVYIR